MGFAAELRAILKKVSDNRQTLLFSATLPAALAEFARAGLKVYPHTRRARTHTVKQ